MKYSGPWTLTQASHLMRRTSFSYDVDMINQVQAMGMDAAVDMLLSPPPTTADPINYNFEEDPEVAIGDTWVNAGYYNVPGLANSRNRSLYAWIMGMFIQKNMNIRDKMTLFWHNHFVVSNIQDARYSHRYYRLLMDNCLGNFKQLVKDITIDPSMLRYLNGNENTVEAPNENYARELLELFTIGKGDLIGPGDYTHYKEDDVIAIARVLTGWRDSGYQNQNNPNVEAKFLANKHDVFPKQLSSHFGDQVIVNANANEYENLIDIIFEQEEVSRFIVRKLFRWFIFHKIDETVENSVIEEWAQVLRDNDYEIKPVIKAMLESEYFYDDEHIGCIIKSPLDFLFGLISFFKIKNPFEGDILKSYGYWLNIGEAGVPLQQVILDLPSVAGWKAYYQEPSYYRIWVNSVTMPIRFGISDILSTVGVGVGDIKLIIDPFFILETVSDPQDINVIIKEFSDHLFCKPLAETQLDYLKNLILQGLPDFEWNIEYTAYLADPTNETIKLIIETRLRLFLLHMLRMPEYQLS